MRSYVVPVNVLEHFLEDVSRHGGNYKGFPRLGVDLQNLENPALREKLEMSSKQTGVLIKRVEVGGSGGQSLDRWSLTGWLVILVG